MSDDTFVLEHPELGGCQATVEAHYYGPVCGAHRLMVVDEEGDIVLDYLNRMDPPDLRLTKIQDLLSEYGFTVPNESEYWPWHDTSCFELSPGSVPVTGPPGTFSDTS